MLEQKSRLRPILLIDFSFDDRLSMSRSVTLLLQEMSSTTSVSLGLKGKRVIVFSGRSKLKNHLNLYFERFSFSLVSFTAFCIDIRRA